MAPAIPSDSANGHLRLLNRNTVTLAAGQLVSVAGVIAMVTLGGILGQRLAPTPALATLPLSFQVLGTAAATIGAAWLMSKVGRARGFATGALIGCIGYLVAVAALALESFSILVAAAGLNGMATAFAQQYRFAAIESVPDKPGPAVSLVLTGSLGGAIAGPGLAAWGETWIPTIPFGGPFVVIAASYLLLVPVLLALDIKPAEQEQESRPPRPLSSIARQPMFLAAVLGSVAGYGVMTFVMTAAPLSMHVVDGHSLAASAAAVQGHALGMYLPSLVTGFLIMRFGAGRMMALGTLVLAATLAIGFAGREFLHYMAAMIALGVGWNFLYIGGTVLLGRAHTPSERFRTQAVNDFSVFGVSALGSLSAGVVMHTFGWHGVLTAAVVPIVIAVATLAIVRPDRQIRELQIS